MLKLATAVVAIAAVLFAPHANAAYREMNDAQMDEVCAKGTTGFDVDLTTVQQMVMNFSQNSAVAQVSGSLLWRVEANTTDPARVQVTVGSQPVALNTSFTTETLQPIQIRAVDAAVRATGDLNISIQTSAALTRALARQHAVLARFGGLRH